MVDLARGMLVLGIDRTKLRADFQSAVKEASAGSDVKKAGEAAGVGYGQGFRTKASAAFQGAVSSMAKAGVATFATIGIASIKMAGDYQAGLTTLVTGAGEAEKNLKLVGSGMLSIAADTGTSTKQLISGMFMIESAGYHGKAGLDVLRAAAEGAKVGGADLGVVANALTTVMKDYGAKAGTAAQATDGLMAIVSHGKVHLEDLSSSLAKVLPTAAALHVTFGAVGGAMATMTGEGTSARLAAMGLNAVMLTLAAPSAAAAKAMGALGLSSKQVADDLTHKGLVYALGEVHAAALKAGPEGSAPFVAAMKTMLGGTQGLRVGLQLTGSHMKDLIANTNAVGAASRGAGKDVTGWELVQKDFNQQLEVLRARVEVAGITIGQRLLPAASSFLGFLTKTHLLIPAVIGILGLLTAAMVVQIGLWLTLENKAGGAMIRMAARAVMWAAAQTASLVETMALWVMYTLGVESAGVATAIATGGIILVVAAIAFAAYELYKHWDVVWKFVKTAAMDAFNWLKANWPLVLAILLGPIATAAYEIYKHWDTIRHGAVVAIDAIKGAWASFTGWIAHVFDTVAGTLARVWHDISQPAVAAFDSVRSAAATAASWLTHAFDAAVAWLRNVWHDISQPVIDQFNRIKTFVTSSFDTWWKANGDAIKEIWQNAWRGILAVFHAVWDPLVASVRTDWRVLQDIFRTGSAVVSAVFRAGWGAILAVYHAVWDTLVTGVRVGWQVLQDIFRVGSAVISTVFRVGWAAILAVFHSVWDPLVVLARAGWAVLTALFTAGVAAIGAVWRYGWMALRATVTAAWTVIQAAFKLGVAVAEAAWNVWWASMTAVVKIAWAAIQAVVKIAWDILVGIFTVAINLVTGRWGGAWTAIKNVGTQVWNQISGFFKTAWAALTALWDTTLTALHTVWNATWGTIKTIISAAWTWIQTTVLNPVKTMFTQTIPGWWDSLIGFTRSRFVTPFQNAIKGAWDWVVTNVFNPWKTLITYTIPGWWDSAVGAIGRAWNKVKALVHDPAAFVVNTILGNLVGGFDTIISWVGLKGPARPHMASKGWMVPGYGGGDRHLALLEGGEVVTPKELVTPDYVRWLKSKGVPGHQFGWIGSAWNGVKGIAGDIGGFASTMWSKVTDAAGIAAALATGNTTALVNDFTKLTGSKIPGGAGAYLSMLGKMPPKVIGEIVSWIISHIGPEAGAAIVAYAKTFLGKIPYVWGGTTLGPAGADCSGFSQAVYAHAGIGAPRTSEAQGSWVQKGTPVAGGLAFYHSPGGGADPGHVAIVQDAQTVISQGGGMGPTMMGIHGMPLLWTGTPPGGFKGGSAGGGMTAGGMSASTIAALWTSLGGPASAAWNMARIAMSESGDVPGVIQKGQPPGLTGYGLFQITPTSGITQGGQFGNLLNASNNIRAAISLYRASGYMPWTSDPVASGLVASGISYDKGGLISEPVLGVGRSGQLYGFAQNGVPEWVSPGRGGGDDDAGGPGMADVCARLDAIAMLLADAPNRTAAGVTAGVAAPGRLAAHAAWIGAS